MSKEFMEAVKERRTYYGIGKDQVVAIERIEEVIQDAVKYTPSAFHSQGQRVVVLFNKEHEALWAITKETLKKIAPEASFGKTEEKLNSFKNGYGTVLYFIDDSVVKSLQNQFELYKDNFPVWAEQSIGMLQYVVWTALTAEGLGASLQHYNPLIDEAIQKKWNIPTSWRLVGQMPFGSRTKAPGEKKFQPIEERMKVFK
jgi:predicted oxidoreductase (fatty acid repression mutant protein)